jgi:hypothetical protein
MSPSSQIAPDVNRVIGELTMQIANLVRENAILKATIAAFQEQNQQNSITDGGELQN